MKRPSAIEPAIGHTKNDGKLGRDWLKGERSDAPHAAPRDTGYDLRMVLRKLSLLYASFLPLCSTAL